MQNHGSRNSGKEHIRMLWPYYAKQISSLRAVKRKAKCNSSKFKWTTLLVPLNLIWSLLSPPLNISSISFAKKQWKSEATNSVTDQVCQIIPMDRMSRKLSQASLHWHIIFLASMTILTSGLDHSGVTHCKYSVKPQWSTETHDIEHHDTIQAVLVYTYIVLPLQTNFSTTTLFPYHKINWPSDHIWLDF